MTQSKTEEDAGVLEGAVTLSRRLGWKNNMEATHTPTNFRIEEVEDTLFHFPCFLTSLHGKERKKEYKIKI